MLGVGDGMIRGTMVEGLISMVVGNSTIRKEILIIMGVERIGVMEAQGEDLITMVEEVSMMVEMEDLMVVEGLMMVEMEDIMVVEGSMMVAMEEDPTIMEDTMVVEVLMMEEMVDSMEVMVEDQITMEDTMEVIGMGMVFMEVGIMTMVTGPQDKGVQSVLPFFSR